MSISWNFILPRLATGGQIGTPADVQELVKAGITAVINCNRGEDDAKLLSSLPGVAYLNNPTDDDGQPKPVTWFQASLEFALPILARPNQRVYAHCAAGVNRGPSTCFAIMRALGFGSLAANGEIVFHRPVCAAGIRYADDADKAVKALGYC